jgi:hypothetical protein
VDIKLNEKQVVHKAFVGMVQNHERAPLQLNEQKEQFPAN